MPTTFTESLNQNEFRMNAYLESQIPYLKQLHVSLGLPDDDLAKDLEGIQEAIKLAIDGRVALRKLAVDKLEKEIQILQKSVEGLRSVLEVKPMNDDSASLMTLPLRITHLRSEEKSLRQTHKERLTKIESLKLEIQKILAIVGESFKLPVELSSKGGYAAENGCSLLPPPPYSSNGEERKADTHVEDVEEIEDVSQGRIAALEQAVALAKAEKAKRQEALAELMEELSYLHDELCLPQTDVHMAGTAWIIPESIAPATVSVHFSRAKPWIARPASPDNDTDRLDALEPTESMMTFCRTLQSSWLAEKAKREQRIQTLFDQIEPIWIRLQVTPEETQAFIEEHCGLSTSTLEAYELELERVKFMRKESLGGFIQTVKEEIQALWESLLYGPRTIEAFEAYREDSVSEELLATHEAEAQRLAEELESKGPLLQKAQEWVDLKNKEEELEAKRNGPDRFNTRGGALLQEEKMRKRIGILKPKLEAELLVLVPEWEETHNMRFLVDDVSIVEVIQLELEAKEAEREAKKRTKIMGGGATPARQSRAPTAMNTHRTPMAKPAPRKREAPTPTPNAHPLNRSMTRPSSSLSHSTSSMGTGHRMMNSLASSTSSSAGIATGFRYHAPPPSCNLPRPASGRSYTVPLGMSGAHNVMQQPRVATMGSSLSGIPKMASAVSLAKEGGRRPKRDSFRPRRSVMRRPDPRTFSGTKDWELEEYDEEF